MRVAESKRAAAMTSWKCRKLRRHEEHPNVADSVYDLMWRRIVHLEAAPRTWHSDEALARDLKVGRPPTRKAPHRLS